MFRGVMCSIECYIIIGVVAVRSDCILTFVGFLKINFVMYKEENLISALMRRHYRKSYYVSDVQILAKILIDK